MLSSRLLLSSISLLALVACNSKVTSALDPDLQAKVALVTDCIPPHMERLNALLDFSDSWRQGDNTNNPPDPAGLNWAESGGVINYCIDVTTFQMAGTIQFYSPAGAQQTGLTLSNVSLSQAIDDAATELRNLFVSGRPFMVGEYTIYEGATCAANGTVSGGTSFSMGVTSSPAALTGLIAGSANQNELEEVRTTEGFAAVAGGPPPVQDETIMAMDGSTQCAFTFRIDSLLTDEFPTQEYPIGVITWSLTDGSQTVAGTLTFDSTVIAVLDVTNVGSFAINLETRAVTSI